MKIYIAKHYWKDGENATWESHEKVDKKIFEYLKKNYHNFVNNRPIMIEEKNSYIYLCYEDNVDIYNRKITNITFFVSKYKVNEPLCSKTYHDLELSLLNKQQVVFFLKLFVVSVGLFFIYSFVFDDVISKNKIMQEDTLKSEIKKKQKIIKEVKVDRNETKERAERYSQILRDGVKCIIYDIGDTKKEKPLKLHNRKVIDTIKWEKEYILENKKLLKINKDELIKLFDNKTLEKKIDEEYSVKLEKV